MWDYIWSGYGASMMMIGNGFKTMMAAHFLWDSQCKALNECTRQTMIGQWFLPSCLPACLLALPCQKSMLGFNCNHRLDSGMHLSARVLMDGTHFSSVYPLVYTVYTTLALQRGRQAALAGLVVRCTNRSPTNKQEMECAKVVAA